MSDHLPFHENIVFLVAKAHQRTQGVLKGHLQSLGITPMQCLFMESLWAGDGVTVGEIGRRISLNTATLAGILDRLVNGGWVLRESDPADGRVARVYLTKKARGVIPQLRAAVHRTNEDLLHGFSLEEKVLCKRFLRCIKG